MSATSQMPAAVAEYLPDYDHKAPFAQAETGETLVAGLHALFIVGGRGLIEAGMWYEVQYASWNAQSRELVVVWVDADRGPLKLVTVSDNPASFMKTLTSRVDRAIVTSRQITVPSGAIITATVRCRVDGALFSSVVVRGEMTEGEHQYLAELEQQVREDVGMV